MRSIGPMTAAILCLAGCSGQQSTAAGESALADFHKRLNAGHIEAIYSDSSTEMKGSTTDRRLTALLEAVHRKLGLFKSGSSAGWNHNYTLNGEFLAIVYNADYERGKAQESFVYHIVGGSAKLAGYHVNSDALILN